MVGTFLQRQLDFIFLVYGLANILLAANAFSLRRLQPRGLPWALLGLFGLVHGAAEWMDMYALALGARTIPAAVHVAFHAAAFLLLLEFGRAGLGRPGRWIHPPLLALAAAGGLAGPDGLQASLRLAVALPGGLLAAGALLRAARSDAADPRGLAPAAAVLALFALAAGALAAPASFFPADILNARVFERFAGIPGETVRCALLLGLAAATWRAQHRLAAALQPDVPWAAEARTGLAFAGLLAALLAAGWGITETLGRQAEAEVRRHLISQARMAAAAINPARLTRLASPDLHETDADCARIREQLAMIADASPSIRHARAAALLNGRLVHAADSVPRGEAGHLDPGAAWEDAPPEAVAVAVSGEPTVAASGGPSPLLSAYAAILDPASWRIVGVLRIDQDGAGWTALVAERRAIALSVTLVLTLLLVGFFVVRSRLLESARAATASERQMAEAQAVAHVGSWTLDPQSGVVTWSDELCRIYGYPPGSPAPAYSAFRKHIHPEDWPRLEAAIRRAATEGTGYEIGLRIVRSDGAAREIVSRAEVRRDARGGIARIVGTSQDVTEQRRAEDALRRLSQAVEQSPVSIVITDREGRIEYVNPKFCQLTGYAPGEVLGRTPRILKSGTMAPEGYRTLWETIQSGGTWRGEFCNRKKDGTLYWENAVISPIKSAAGAISHFLAVKEDISDRRRFEQALRESAEKFHILFDAAPDPILVIDGMNRIADCNAAAARAFGLEEKADLVGKHPGDLSPVRQPDGRLSTLGADESLQMARDRGRFAFEWVHSRRDHSEFVADISLSIVPHGDQQLVLAHLRDVTERKRAEAVVAEARQKYADLVGNLAVGVYRNTPGPDGRFLEVNPAIVAMFEAGTREELLKRRVRDVYVDPAQYAALGERLLQAGAVRNEELELRTLRGRVFWASVSAVMRRDRDGAIYFDGTIEDITARKQSQEALRRNEERLRAILDAIQAGIVLVDPDTHRIVDINPVALGMIGTTRDQIVGVPCHRNICPAEAGRCPITDLGQRVDNAERVLITASGERKPILKTVTRIDIGGRPLVLESFIDISEQKRAEAALREAKEAAESATRAKSDFLARMSHELRTPLNSVIGFTNILLKNRGNRLEPQEMTYLDRVRANALHLLGLINDILDLSKVEAGRMKAELAPVDLEALLRETLALLDGQAQQKRVRLAADLPPGLPPVVSDAAKLKQILINLAGNAIKFSEGGSVTLRVAADPATGAPARIDVADTGIGIPPEKLPRLFQPFEQGDSGTSRKYGGTGLGLAICKAFADLLGCRITVASETGKGSTFSVHLPAASPAPAGRPGSFEVRAETTAASEVSPPAPRDDAASGTRLALPAPPAKGNGTHPPAPPARVAPSPAADLAGRTVLVIDDHEDARLLLAQALEEAQCRVLQAASGPAGLVLAAAHRPDAIVLDLLMPGMSGWDVLRSLQADPALRAIPVVVVSVVASERRASLLGDVALLDKPVDPARLTDVLARALRRPSGRVLVVDDDAEDRLLAREHLARAGYAVREAADGQAALDALADFEPDLVLLDLVMPGMDGAAFLAELRAHPRWSALPVVILTAKALDTEEARRLAVSTSAVMRKGDHTMDDVRKALESALRPPAGGEARPIVVRARRRLESLIPGYLENRRKDVKALQDALERLDFEAVRILGHNMKGTGRGYGFDAISEIGRALEEGAKRRDPGAVCQGTEDLSDYVNRVEVVYD